MSFFHIITDILSDKYGFDEIEWVFTAIISFLIKF